MLESHSTRVPLERLTSSVYDTVAIVGLDGYARARATFKPRNQPLVGNAAPLMQMPAFVAAGSVFYVDGPGVVRRLSTDGSVVQAADFPVANSQTEVSFAVSPDGQHLVATVLKYPPPQPHGDLMHMWVPGSTSTLTLEKADFGGQTQTVWTRSWPEDQYPSGGYEMISGWDQSAPVMAVNAHLGAQNWTSDEPFTGESLAHLDLSTGNLADTMGGKCHPWTELFDGTLLCAGGAEGGVVASASGSPMWSLPANAYPVGDSLSPDAAHATVNTTYGPMAGNEMVGRDGSVVEIPGGYLPEGWLDAQTVIGVKLSGLPSNPGDMATLSLSNPSHLNDLGFKGYFVGVVETP